MTSTITEPMTHAEAMVMLRQAMRSIGTDSESAMLSAVAHVFIMDSEMHDHRQELQRTRIALSEATASMRRDLAASEERIHEMLGAERRSTSRLTRLLRIEADRLVRRTLWVVGGGCVLGGVALGVVLHALIYA